MASRILYVGHSTVLVELDGVRLLTDPVLRRRLLHLRRVGGSAAPVPSDLDAVLLSHLHYDHLDFPSLRRVGRDVRIVAPLGARPLLARKGFSDTVEIGVGETLELHGVEVRGVPAVHPPGRLPFGARVEPMGFVLGGSRSVYFAGDTALFDGMAALGPVDLALLPIWGWGPALGAGHLDPETAAEAALRLRAAVVVPIHWGTYFPAHTGLWDTPAFVERPAAQFAARMRKVAPDVDVRVLRPGDETTLG